jgi:hypothetical protein
METTETLYTMRLIRKDWERIIDALRATAVSHHHAAHRVGADGTYGAALFEEGGYCLALADEIDFIFD